MALTDEVLKEWKALATGDWPTDRANASALVKDRRIACDARALRAGGAPPQNGAVWGVLDLDSPSPGRFRPEEAAVLERLCAALPAPWASPPWDRQ